MRRDSRSYNLSELKIALDPGDPRRILPPPQPAAARVLDVGCGAGQSLIAAFPDRVSFGVDIDFAALQLGKSLSDRTCLVNSSAESLPFKSHQFDLVFARVSLPYTNIPASLREMRRVLKANGRVWLVLHPLTMLWSRARSSNFKSQLYCVYVLLNGLAFHLFQWQFSLLGQRFESFQTEGGMRRALIRAGFDDVQIAREPYYLVTARARPS